MYGNPWQGPVKIFLTMSFLFLETSTGNSNQRPIRLIVRQLEVQISPSVLSEFGVCARSCQEISIIRAAKDKVNLWRFCLGLDRPRGFWTSCGRWSGSKQARPKSFCGLRKYLWGWDYKEMRGGFCFLVSVFLAASVSCTNPEMWGWKPSPFPSAQEEKTSPGPE